jgi:polar amino acid transport system permease protein
VLGLCSPSCGCRTTPTSAFPTAGIVEFIRSTPLLIQIFFIYFVFPEFGVTLNALTAGIMALGLHYGTYCSEVYRAGIEGVPRGQWEAATALNLSPYDTFKDIIIPQAIPPVVPALGNYLVALFKETPLLVGHRRARAHADRQDPRLADLPLYRADHAGRGCSSWS